MKKMADFNTIGFEEIEKELLRDSEKAKEMIPRMLKAGAEVLVEAQKKEAKNLEVEDSGDLIRSIKASDAKESGLETVVVVSPTGKNHQGVRNAEVGFVNEYGTSKQAARPWMETANIKSENAVHLTMQKIWEEADNGNR